MAVHIFIDSSNIYGGVQTAAKSLEPATNSAALRLHYRNLFTLLEDDRDVGARVLAGSYTAANAGVFKYATECGYEADLLRRVGNEDGSVSEQAVDEMLHLRIANALLDFDPPQTLVLATGDGREHRRDCSFPRQVVRAIKRGWNVEVYSWTGCLSPAFGDIGVRAPCTLSVRHLDDYYYAITFFKGGRSIAQGIEFDLGERRAVYPRKKDHGRFW